MITQDLGIDKLTVGRIIIILRTTGSVSSKSYLKEKTFRKLTAVIVKH